MIRQREERIPPSAQPKVWKRILISARPRAGIGLPANAAIDPLNKPEISPNPHSRWGRGRGGRRRSSPATARARVVGEGGIGHTILRGRRNGRRGEKGGVRRQLGTRGCIKEITLIRINTHNRSALPIRPVTRFPSAGVVHGPDVVAQRGVTAGPSTPSPHHGWDYTSFHYD